MFTLLTGYKKKCFSVLTHFLGNHHSNLDDDDDDNNNDNKSLTRKVPKSSQFNDNLNLTASVGQSCL